MTRAQVFAHARHHYFLAMLQGWVSGSSRVLGKSQESETVYEDEDFRIVDRFGKFEDKVSGMVGIWHQGDMIWFMNYCGFYQEEDIPLLKSILKTAFQNGEFIGGRGPVRSAVGTKVYTNEVVSGSSFLHFRGTEKISDSSGVVRGYHNYWGEMLF